MSYCVDEDTRFELIAKKARFLAKKVIDDSSMSLETKSECLHALGYIEGLCNQDEESKE